MIISKAEITDLNPILNLQYEAYQSEAEIYQDYNIQPLKQSISELEEEYKLGVILKATYHSEIVGSVRATVEDGICKIGKLIVKPEFQNQGIGKKLMNEIEKFYSEVKQIELFTGHKSLKNLEFYKNRGYQKFKEVEVNESLILIYLRKKA
ncbi:GNAT family N-acetyltransferase [Cohnella cholangitidis]|uniref:GNAT family N-acetyltransferase n=1 Tax=Cohnella cholangitidis TaxID=2598458 RepID=A0A7G5BSV7_9BACL|nr:GNAT family N-acetyltransferase [Cohnella cholangitidis]QMV40041.1 GNAT family N-acetyltransferase [Cohnella cholangitidis]